MGFHHTARGFGVFLPESLRGFQWGVRKSEKNMGETRGTPILGKLHINFWESHGISIFYVNQFQSKKQKTGFIVVWHS